MAHAGNQGVARGIDEEQLPNDPSDSRATLTRAGAGRLLKEDEDRALKIPVLLFLHYSDGRRKPSPPCTRP